MSTHTFCLTLLHRATWLSAWLHSHSPWEYWEGLSRWRGLILPLTLILLNKPGLNKEIQHHKGHHTLTNQCTCASPDQTPGHSQHELSAWWLQMTTLILLSGVCADMYELTCSFYHPPGRLIMNEVPIGKQFSNRTCRFASDGKKIFQPFHNIDICYNNILLSYR